MTTFIKEYCEHARIVVIRSRPYGSKMSMLQEAFEVARQDGFDITAEDCYVVRYAGKRYKRTFGIEFSYDNAPEQYWRILNVEYTP